MSILTEQWDGATDENFDAVYAQMVKLPEQSTSSTLTTWVLESLGNVEFAVAVLKTLEEHGWEVSAALESPDKSVNVFYASPMTPQDTL